MKSLLAVLISIVATFYAAELILAVVPPSPQPSSLRISKALAEHHLFDMREDWEVVADLRQTKQEVYQAIVPSEFWPSNGLPTNNGGRLFPLGAIAGSTIVYCNENGFYNAYVSDRHGFNNPENLKYDVAELLLVGDSFAHGACVNPPADVGGRLREYGHQVINIGFGGNGPLTEFAGIREYGKTLRPKFVIWLYFEGNDVTDLSFERNVPTLMRYLENGFSQGLMGRQGEIDSLLRNFVVEFERTRNTKPTAVPASASPSLAPVLRLMGVRKLLGEARRLAGDGVYLDELRENLSLFDRTLVAAKREVESWNGSLLFVYLPAHDRFTNRLRLNNKHLYQRETVLNIVHRNGIELLDFHRILAEQPDSLRYFPFRVWGHFNGEGYELLAAEIHRTLLERGTKRSDLPAAHH